MRRAYVVIGIVGAIAVGGAVSVYWVGFDSAPSDMPGMPDMQAAAPQETKVGERKVLYWFDPMNPQLRFDKPGKSPSMDMDLVPKYADEGGDAGSIRIDPSMTQNLGLRLATVATGKLVSIVEAPATVQFNQRDVTIVQARSAGFVERAYGRAPGDLVKKGAPLVDLLISEWAGAQIEFIDLQKIGDAGLIAAARERLVLLGMPRELILAVERTREPRIVVTVLAPADGVITSIGVQQGMSVMAGEMLAEINGFSPIWLEAQVPEAEAQTVRSGQPAHAEFPVFPGERIQGRVAAVLPEINADARTARVRIELPNRDGRLRPGLFARVSIEARAGAEVPLLPSEAIIRTGQRAIVMVAEEDGRYRPVEVKLGREVGGRIEVLDGIQPGQQVVASGQFLIDSEASIRGVFARTRQPEAIAASTPLHEGQGTVENISSGEVTLSHGPIPTLKLGAMTMPFRLERGEIAEGLKPGDRVRFAFRQDDEGFTIEKLSKEAASR